MGFGILFLTILGIAICIAAATLLAIVTYSVASQKEPVLSSSQMSTSRALGGAAIATLSMVIIGLVLYAAPFFGKQYSFFSSEMQGPILVSAILVILLLPAIALVWMVAHRTTVLPKQPRFFGQLNFASGAIALFLLFNLGTTMTVYSIKTLRKQNLASDRSHYYHGPAPIVGGSANSYSSKVTIAYGGEWACPQNPSKEICTVETSLSPCSTYDNVAGRTAYWRRWNGRDHWADVFSCAEGPLDVVAGNNGNNNNEDNDDDNNNNGYVAYVNNYENTVTSFDSQDASTWPYQIQIIADCRDTCLAMVDDVRTRDLFFSVEHLKGHMLLNSFGAVVFFLIGPLLRRFRCGRGEENQKQLVQDAEENVGTIA